MKYLLSLLLILTVWKFSDARMGKCAVISYSMIECQNWYPYIHDDT